MKNKANFDEQFINMFKNDMQQWQESQQVYTKLTVVLDDVICQPSKYSELLSRIESLQEGDVLEVVLDSIGGDLDGCIAIVAAIESTQAEVVAVLRNRVFSAASIIALRCANVQISPYARMMIHAKTGGYFGKDHELEADYEFNQKYIKNFFRESYKYFLTEAEINNVLSGADIWLDAEEINTRLERKMLMLEKEQQKQLKELRKKVQGQEEHQVEPMVKPSKKPKVKSSEQAEEKYLD